MRRGLAMLTLLLLVVVAAQGCSSGGADGSPATEGASGNKGAPTLKQFLDADTKTGTYETHTEYRTGDTLDHHGTFWIDGRVFRYDIYEGETLTRSVMSPDGKTAYFVRHDEEICEPSVASVDYYLMRYSMPDAGGVEDGVDEETGAARIVYSVKRTEDMPGAANPWYSEDVTYLVLNDEVIGVITRGGVPEDDGSVDGLDVNRELWSDIEIGMAIPADTFELPYPIQDAE